MKLFQSTVAKQKFSFAIIGIYFSFIFRYLLSSHNEFVGFLLLFFVFVLHLSRLFFNLNQEITCTCPNVF